MKNDIILFETEDSEVSLQVQMQDETVWLSRNQMAELFDRDVKTIGKHINNAIAEELDGSTVAKIATVQKEGDRNVRREIEYYNLDVIISVGYRVKSQRGVEFRRWANSVLKDYILRGYAVNDKRISQLGQMVQIMKRAENHSFSDGNKRIAATMFLYFLDKNGALFADGSKRIADYTLVALTIMIAESKPEEKEMMVNVIMNCLV